MLTYTIAVGKSCCTVSLLISLLWSVGHDIFAMQVTTSGSAQVFHAWGPQGPIALQVLSADKHL